MIDTREKAKAAGADCDNCPFGEDSFIAPDPVYPDLPRRRSRLVVVGEGPGRVEEKEGEFFAGPAGEKLDACLSTIGTSRKRTNVTNATLCFPPPGTTSHVLREAAKACRPRLAHDLERLATKRGVIIAMGAASLFSLCGPEYKSITPWIGAPLPLDGFFARSSARVVPSFHVAYAMRVPLYWKAVLEHMDLAWRLANGGRLPRWQKIVTAKNDREAPRAIAALKAIRDRGEEVGFDIETAGKSPWAPITAVGVADSKVAVSVLAYIFFRPGVFSLFRDILERQESIAQNGWHDVIGLRENGIDVRKYLWGIMEMHATLAPFMRHNLGLIAAVEIPGLDRWKSKFKDDDRKGSIEWKTIAERRPDELLIYNGKDDAILPRLKKTLWPQIKNSPRLRRRYYELMEISAGCAEMRANGILIDQKIRKRLVGEVAEKRSQALEDVQSIAHKLGYRKEVHPRRRVTLIDLFYRELNLPVLAKSKKTGDPAVHEQAIVRLMLQIPDAKVQKLLKAVLTYRKYDKLAGTYLAKLDPSHPESHVDHNSVIRASFNACGTGTGRLSCSDPNMQNWPPAMRELIRARPGWRLVCADFGQVEMRIEAAFAGDEPLLTTFREGEDVHWSNARSIWPKRAAEGTLTKADRTLAKRYAYGRRGGSAEAIWESIIVEAPESGVTVSRIRKIDRAFKRAHPRLGIFNAELIRSAEVNDYIELPLSGRRIHYHGKVKSTEPIAHLVQSTAADVMNDAFLKLRKMLDPKCERLLSQVHDEIMVESQIPVETAQKLKTCMERTIELNGNEIELPIDWKVGSNLGRAKECDTIAKVRRAAR